jgi:transposase
MVGKRHALEEISVKLAQADNLVAKGKTQREISSALGVSVMTYHRWKKMLKSHQPTMNRGLQETTGRLHSPGDGNSEEAIRRLELENAQLRRLVTDTLLEKLKYEEELRAHLGTRMRRPDNG